MSKTSCIAHPANTPFLMIRADYLMLCDGNACAATLLNEFEQMENHALRQHERDGEWAKPGTEAPDSDRWFYWTRKDISRKLFHVYGDATVDKALALLADKGFVQRREKGENKLDHRYQYRFDVAKTQAALNDLNAADFDASISKQRVSRMKHRSFKNATLSTSKTKTKTKDKNTPLGVLPDAKPDDATPAPDGALNPPADKKPTRSRKPTVYEPQFVALLDWFKLDRTTLTRSAAGLYWKVAKELHDVGMTPDDVTGLCRYVADKARRGKWDAWKATALPQYAPDYLRDRRPSVASDSGPRYVPKPPTFSDDELREAREWQARENARLGIVPKREVVTA